jgi:hypothetical protein
VEPQPCPAHGCWSRPPRLAGRRHSGSLTCGGLTRTGTAILVGSCGEERERTRANPEAIGVVQKTQEEAGVLVSDPGYGQKSVQTETPDGGYHRTQILVLLCGPGVKVLPGELRSPGWAVSWLSFRSDQRSGLTRLR